MPNASKLTERAYAIEQVVKAEEARDFLRELFGIYNAEQNATIKFLEGYITAMKSIIIQGEL